MVIENTSKVSDDAVTIAANNIDKTLEETKRKPTNPTLYKYKMYSRLSKNLMKRSPNVKSF